MQDLDIGAKHVKLYVSQSLIFDGHLDKGGGEAPADQCILVGLENENERMECPVSACGERSEEARALASTDGDKELSVRYSPPAGAAVGVKGPSPGNVFGGRTMSPDCTKDSLSRLEDAASLSAAPASMGGVPGAAPPPPAGECPPVHQDLSLVQQLENLTGRKVSEPPGKYPSWLQPSPLGKGRKLKPLWLHPEKPLDWKDRFLSEDIICEGPGETEAGDKGPTHEQGRASSWNVLSEERAQRVTPRVCSDDLDIFNQPASRGRPASGRRGPKKDAGGGGLGDGQLASKGKAVIPAGGPDQQQGVLLPGPQFPQLQSEGFLLNQGPHRWQQRVKWARHSLHVRLLEILVIVPKVYPFHHFFL